MPYPNLLVGGAVEDPFVPTDLFAGDGQVLTDQVTVASGQNLEQFEVITLDAAGLVVALGDGSADTVFGGGAVGIMCQAVDATGSTMPGSAYVAGDFNHTALVWPGALDTLAERKKAFAGTPINVKAPIAAP